MKEKEFLEQSKGLLKSKKPKKMFSEILEKAVASGLLLAYILCIFTFSGCRKAPDDPVNTDPPYVDTTPINPSPDVPPEIKPAPPIVEVGPTTMESFHQEYQEDALEFAKEVLTPHIAEGHQVLSYGFECDDSGKIDVVKARTIIPSGEKRTIAMERITFTTPISVQDVYKKNYQQEDLAGTYRLQEFIEFDTRENYYEQDIVESLMIACNVTGGQNFYKELSDENAIDRVFHLAHLDTTTNMVNVYRVEVRPAKDETIEVALKRAELINEININGMGKYPIHVDSYKIENKFQPETYEEFIKYYSEDFNKGLMQSFIPEVARICYYTFDVDNILDAKWTVLQKNNQITGFQLFIDYQERGKTLFKIVDITLDKPLDYKDFTAPNSKEILDEAASKTKISAYISYSYNESTQNTRHELKSTLFEGAEFSYSVSSSTTRYLEQDPNTYQDTWGDTTQFTLLQINSDKATKLVINVKKANSDEEYIKNIEKGYFRVVDKVENKICEGEEFTYVEEDENDFELE